MMANKGIFRDLIVWQKAIQMTKQVYRISQGMPDSERFGLTAQMRRAAVSVASNIAEGNSRQSIPDYLKFLATARGSLAELETQIIIAEELQMIQESSSLLSAVQETRRMLQALMDSLRKKL